jgi:hypothetical protein
MRLRRSWNPHACRHALLLVLALPLLGAAGCAHSAPAKQISLAELRRGALADWRGDGPLIVEFRPGDRLPVELDFQSQFFGLEQPAAGMELVVKERCFVRFDENGVRTSPDGIDFETEEPGRFGIHLVTTKTTATTLKVQIVAPRHARK